MALQGAGGTTRPAGGGHDRRHLRRRARWHLSLQRLAQGEHLGRGAALGDPGCGDQRLEAPGAP